MEIQSKAISNHISSW